MQQQEDIINDLRMQLDRTITRNQQTVLKLQQVSESVTTLLSKKLQISYGKLSKQQVFQSWLLLTLEHRNLHKLSIVAKKYRQKRVLQKSFQTLLLESKTNMKNRLVNEGAKRLDLATQHVSLHLHFILLSTY